MFSYSSTINKTVESTVLEVRALYGRDKWSKADIKGKTFGYCVLRGFKFDSQLNLFLNFCIFKMYQLIY